MSLYKKYILVIVILLFIIIFFFSYKNFKIASEQIKNRHKEHIEFIAGFIKNGIKAMMLEGRGNKFREFLDAINDGDINAVRIVSGKGVIVCSSKPEEIGKTLDEKDLKEFLRYGQLKTIMHQHNDTAFFLSMITIENEWPCHRCHDRKDSIRGMLVIESSTDTVDREISLIRRSSVKTALSVFLFFLIASGVSGYFLFKKPFDELKDAIKKVEKGNLKVRINNTKDDEIAEIATTLSNIFASLEKAKAEIEACRKKENRQIERMASLGELAATVAHEIKNPLAGISGALQVMAEDISENDPRKEICNEMLNEIDRLDSAVKDLLFFAKPPAMHFILGDINAIIERVIDVISKSAPRIKMRIDFSKSILPLTMLDPEKLEKAFLNIAYYSIQTMNDDGVLTIFTREDQERREINVIFSDTGSGIPDWKLSSIFKPFFSTKQFGTGLGLAISRNIVENHNGSIEVESIVGKGTTFRIIIPVITSNGK